MYAQNYEATQALGLGSLQVGTTWQGLCKSLIVPSCAVRAVRLGVGLSAKRCYP